MNDFAILFLDSLETKFCNEEEKRKALAEAAEKNQAVCVLRMTPAGHWWPQESHSNRRWQKQ